MASFDTVNYSLRPSKGLQRHLVFDGIERIRRLWAERSAVYIGFGSVWFSDFILAHRRLSVDDMVSLEGDEIGYRRAVFNRPYATVTVEKGFSTTVLPTLIDDQNLVNRPWVVWLDYDKAFSPDVAEDIRLLAARAPNDTILLVTVKAVGRSYGKLAKRAAFLRALFGTSKPSNENRTGVDDDGIGRTLADLLLGKMSDDAIAFGRQGEFIPAFRIPYKDSSDMVTVGGVFSNNRGPEIHAMIAGEDWRCMPEQKIVAPHLTARETASLQSLLPRKERLTRTDIQGLGFDLDEQQIAVFETYYKEFPTYAQVTL